MDLSKFKDLHFLFDTQPTPEIQSFFPLLFIFSILFLVGLLLSLLLHFKKFSPLLASFVRKIPGKLYAVSVIGAALLFFRYEGSPYLSMRFLLLATILIFVIWAIWYAISFAIQYPKRKAAQEEREKMGRYKPGQ